MPQISIRTQSLINGENYISLSEHESIIGVSVYNNQSLHSISSTDKITLSLNDNSSMLVITIIQTDSYPPIHIARSERVYVIPEFNDTSIIYDFTCLGAFYVNKRWVAVLHENTRL